MIPRVIMEKENLSQRSNTMRFVKSYGSKIEVRLSKALWKLGYRYRKNNRTVFGKPDITFKKYKIAIFVDSEFWHGKDWVVHKYDHKSNTEYWHAKIERNMNRDKEVNAELKKTGWTVLRFWGRDIEKNLDYCIEQIVNEIEKKQKSKPDPD